MSRIFQIILSLLLLVFGSACKKESESKQVAAIFDSHDQQTKSIENRLHLHFKDYPYTFEIIAGFNTEQSFSSSMSIRDLEEMTYHHHVIFKGVSTFPQAIEVNAKFIKVFTTDELSEIDLLFMRSIKGRECQMSFETWRKANEIGEAMLEFDQTQSDNHNPFLNE